ncbi:MAG: rod shape-determining protein MreC [Limisphaerales bacterium]
MFNKSSYIALSLVGLLALVVLNLPDKAAGQIKLAIAGLFLPLFGLAGSAHSLTAQAGNALLPRKALLRQNEELRQQNDQLRFQAMQGGEALRENNQLRQLLGFQKQTPWRLKPAHVVARDPANWWRTIQVDLGSRDGMRVNLPVLTVDGLVGRTAAVDLNRSQVVLVGDPNCRVAALVAETRDTGIVVPTSPASLDPELVNLTYLSRSSLLKPGQRVVTSGLGGIFPKGILIGDLVDTRTVEYGLYTEARVKLAVNLNRLEEVWVLVP